MLQTSRAASGIGFFGALALLLLMTLGTGSALGDSLNQLQQAQANISALIEQGDTHAKADLEAARTDLTEATAVSLWVDPNDAVPPPEGQVVFAKATRAIKQLDHVLNDRTVPESALLETRAEILEAEADLAATAGEQPSGFHSPPGTPVAKWKAAYRELGKQLADAVTSLPDRTLEEAASNYANALIEKTVQLNATPQAITGPPLTNEGKPELFYYGAEGCPFCAIERWSMLTALGRFGKFKALGPMVSSTTDLDASTRTLSFFKAKYTSPYFAFVPDEAYTNQPPCESCGFWTALQPPTAAEQELINAYDMYEYEGQIYQVFPFLDTANKWATVSSTADPALLTGMSWQQIVTAMGDPNSNIGQTIDGGAELITAQICEADGGQPSSVCDSLVVQFYEEALKTGF